MDSVQVLSYAAVASLAIMTPGADFAILVKHAARGGSGAGFRAAAGVTLGFAVHATVAAAGVGALLLTSATAFAVVKLLGAAYLIYLGVRSLRSAIRSQDGANERPAGAVSDTVGRPFREALAINVLNPKVVLTYLALMPQFLSATAGEAETLLLSAVTVAIAGVWFTLLAIAVGAVRVILSRPWVRRGLDAVTGTVLVGLGFRLATARQV